MNAYIHIHIHLYIYTIYQIKNNKLPKELPINNKKQHEQLKENENKSPARHSLTEKKAASCLDIAKSSTPTNLRSGLYAYNDTHS